MEEKKHGGRRENAGPKKKEVVRDKYIKISLTEVEYNNLTQNAKKQKLAEFIREKIAKYL